MNLDEVRIMLRVIIVLIFVSLSSAVQAKTLTTSFLVLGSTPFSRQIPFPTFGAGFEFLFFEHLELNLAANGSMGYAPVNGLSGATTHGSLTAGLIFRYDWFGIGAHYFTQSHGFNFAVLTNETPSTRLGSVSHSGRLDFAVVMLKFYISDKLMIFGGPGIEILRRNDYATTIDLATANNAELVGQFQQGAREMEANYHNFIDQYKVYLGAAVRLGSI